MGESLLAQAERLRDAGHDVGAVKLTALRPFPGVRLVKMLARAQAITVVEAVDEPLAQSNPLTREIKAAFADAITWAPEYPGVGRVPRIFAGYVGPGSRELDGADADAIVANMNDGDRERRTFVLGGLRARGTASTTRSAPAGQDARLHGAATGRVLPAGARRLPRAWRGHRRSLHPDRHGHPRPAHPGDGAPGDRTPAPTR